MQRHIRNIANDPTVVLLGRNVEQFASPQRDDTAVFESRRGLALNEQAYVLNETARETQPGADMC
jgi:hypothetical protein